jgi:hypothetical protein
VGRACESGPVRPGLSRERERDMKSFSNDSDILRYETILFGEMHLRGQVIASGTAGAVSGTHLTATGASFITAGVEAGCVVYLSNAGNTIGAGYEIVSVDSETQLTVSVIRGERAGAAQAPPAASDVAYRVCSYGPQANEAFVRLCEYFRITPEQAETIENTEGLRQASVHLTIATVFAIIAGREGFAQGYLDKSDKYTDGFLRGLERCRFTVEIDGKTVTKRGGEIYLERE